MADKTKTIKNATDKELDELIIRLRKERELQGLIADLKRSGNFNEIMPYDRLQVSTEEAIETLYHYGIPGMKWGRRRARSIGESMRKYKANRKPIPEYDPTNMSNEAIQKRKLRKKSIDEMTNADLKALNTRLQLEKQYRDLSKEQLSPGKKFIVDTLMNSGKQTASQYASKAMTKGVETALKMAIK